MKNHTKQYIWKALSVLLILTCICLSGGCAVGGEPARTAAIAVLYTGDVHCAVDENIGYSGLSAFKNSLTDSGCEVLLVDSGDAIQGGAIGSFSKGKSIIQIMNELGYSAMALGNHEFDYGGDACLNELAQLATFPFLSVNYRRDGKAVYAPYTIVERDGVKLAFVGVSMPKTITSSTPAYFMDSNGTIVCDFLSDNTGSALWTATQEAVNAARNDGADYVFALTHLGISSSSSPYTSSELIAHTVGIDAVLDGHSHSVLECERVKNQDGAWVLLSSTGTKLEHIGLLMIDQNGNLSTGLVSEVDGEDASVTAMIEEMKSEYSEQLKTVVSHLDTALTTDDPETGARLIRNAETNLGDFCADAYRAAGNADIAFINGGAIRASIPAGDVTLEDVLSVNPYGNMLCKVSVTGQAILDALEFGARSVPDERGSFLQVSGLTYEIHTELPSAVEMDENEMFVAVNGAYRVQNVLVGGEPLVLDKTYTVVSHNYMLKNNGDGYTMMSGGELLMDEFLLDSDALTQYLNGGYQDHPELYADPYGEGRITVVTES